MLFFNAVRQLFQSNTYRKNYIRIFFSILGIYFSSASFGRFTVLMLGFPANEIDNDLFSAYFLIITFTTCQGQTRVPVKREVSLSILQNEDPNEELCCYESYDVNTEMVKRSFKSFSVFVSQLGAEITSGWWYFLLLDL